MAGPKSGLEDLLEDLKNIAYETGATNKGIYSLMDKIIKTGSRIAISISEKI